MKHLFFTVLLLVFFSKVVSAQESKPVAFMTGEVLSISADNVLTCTNIAGDIPGTKDSLTISKVVDMSTIIPNMKGEMTIGVATGILKSKTAKTAVIKIIKYTTKVDDNHIIKVGNKLKLGWSSPERVKLYEQYELANREFNLKNYEKAIELFQSALAIDSNHVQSLIKIARSYKAINDPFSSLKYYDRVVQIEPNNYQSRFDRSALCFTLSRTLDAIFTKQMDKYAIKGLDDVNALLAANNENKLTLDDENKKFLYQLRIIFKITANKQNECCEDLTKLFAINEDNPSLASEEDAEFVRLKELYCSSKSLRKKATRYHELTLTEQNGDGDTLRIALADSMKSCSLQLSKSTVLKVGDTVLLGNCEKMNLLAVAQVISLDNEKEFSLRIIRWNITEKELTKIKGMTANFNINAKLYCPVRSFGIPVKSRFYCYW